MKTKTSNCPVSISKDTIRLIELVKAFIEVECLFNNTVMEIYANPDRKIEEFYIISGKVRDFLIQCVAEGISETLDVTGGTEI